MQTQAATLKQEAYQASVLSWCRRDQKFLQKHVKESGSETENGSHISARAISNNRYSTRSPSSPKRPQLTIVLSGPLPQHRV